MKHVFLCYSSRDRAVVRRVAADMRRAGVPLWFDEERIGIGDNFVTKISEGLAESAYILVFLSRGFLESEWVKHEWSSLFCEEVASKSTKVIPLLVDDLPGELPPVIGLLRAKKYVDLRGQSYEEGIKTLRTFFANRLDNAESAVSTSEHALDSKGATLQVHPVRDERGNFLLSYWLDGDRLQDITIRAEQLEGILASLARDFPRIQHRFGKDATAPLLRIAQSFSHYLFPPSVTRLLLAEKIHRLRVLVDETSPVLPWELAHDGDAFLGLKLFIVYSPLDGRGSVGTSEMVRSILVVECLTSTPGIELDRFLSGYLKSINPGSASVNRVRASNLQDIRKGIQQLVPDVVHCVAHTTSGTKLEFGLGESTVTCEQLCETLGEFSATKLVVLDACETARCFGRVPSYDTNSAYRLSVFGLNVIGTVGWLEMTTSEQFSLFLYDALGKARPLEAALLESKTKLDIDDKEWWVFTHFGPGSPADRALVNTAEHRNRPEPQRPAPPDVAVR